jgi:hypothetical protein
MWICVACRCNHDIKFIASNKDAKGLVYYNTDYITKSALSTYQLYTLMKGAVEELEIGQSIAKERYDVATAIDKSRLMVIRCLNRILSQQEMSGQQVVSYLLGLPDHYTSHTFKRLYWNDIDNWAATQEKPDEDAKPEAYQLCQEDVNDSSDSESDSDIGGSDSEIRERKIIQHNQRVDYMYRNAKLHHLSVYEFVREINKMKICREEKRLANRKKDNKKTGRPAEARFPLQSAHPQGTSHLHKSRPESSFVVPEICGKSVPCRPAKCESAEEMKLWEQYARTVVLLFTPWHKFSDIKQKDQTWKSTYDRILGNLNPRMITVLDNIQLLHDSKVSRDKVMALRDVRRKLAREN